MKKRLVRAAQSDVEVIRDSEVAVRVDVKETRTTSVKLEDVLQIRPSGSAVLLTLRNDVGRFKRGHAFAKVVRRGDRFVAIPFMFVAPSTDAATGMKVDPFEPSYPIKENVKVRGFLALTYRKLTDLEGVSPVDIDAGEVNPAPVAE